MPRTSKALPYRKELDQLRLVELFTRVKHGNPTVLSVEDFTRVRRLLTSEDLAAVRSEPGIVIE